MGQASFAVVEKTPKEGRTIVFCTASQKTISEVSAGFVQLPPRIVQTSRLDFALVSDDTKRGNFDVRGIPTAASLLPTISTANSPYTTLLASTSVRPTPASLPLSSTLLASSPAGADTKSVLQPG